MGPIRAIHRRLDPFTVKGPVRKAIEGKYIELMLGQKLLECLELPGLPQAASSLCRQAQPYTKCLMRGNARLYREHMGTDVLKYLVPALPRMNVGAIREVRARCPHASQV